MSVIGLLFGAEWVDTVSDSLVPRIGGGVPYRAGKVDVLLGDVMGLLAVTGPGWTGARIKHAIESGVGSVEAAAELVAGLLPGLAEQAIERGDDGIGSACMLAAWSPSAARFRAYRIRSWDGAVPVELEPGAPHFEPQPTGIEGTAWTVADLATAVRTIVAAWTAETPGECGPPYWHHGIEADGRCTIRRLPDEDPT